VTTTLLAVDDSKTMRKVMEITFAGEDYRTVLAENSADALQKLKSEKPSIALVDAQLGGESGYDLCQSIKRESPGVAVVILSSKQRPYDRARGTSVGADDFMDKPFDTQQLIEKVSAVARKAAEAPAAAPAPAPAAQRPAAPPAAAAPSPASRPAHVQTQSFGAPPASRQAPKPAAAPPVSRPQAPAAPMRPAAPAPVARPAAPAPAAARPAPAPAAAVAAAVPGNLAGKLQGLGLTPDQIRGVLALSREVIEQVVWEVVPVLAETMIQEEIKRLTSE
jgi:CheY-like chemotaxis protein